MFKKHPLVFTFLVAFIWLGSVYGSFVLGKHLERGATDYNYWLGSSAIVLPIIIGLWMIYLRVSKVPE